MIHLRIFFRREAFIFNTQDHRPGGCELFKAGFDGGVNSLDTIHLLYQSPLSYLVGIDFHVLGSLNPLGIKLSGVGLQLSALLFGAIPVGDVKTFSSTQ